MYANVQHAWHKSQCCRAIFVVLSLIDLFTDPLKGTLEGPGMVNLARIELILTVVRSYLTRIVSYEEVARANNNIHEIKGGFAVFKIFIRVDLELQLVSSS